MRKWHYVVLIVVCIAVGYLLRGAINREVLIWLTVGALGLVVILKIVQLGLMHFVKVLESRMSPDERQEFEEFKKQHADGDKTK